MTDYKEFAAKIKAKYPQYKDVDDLTLAQKVVEKYPQYKEKVEFSVTEEKTQPRELKPIDWGKDYTPSGIAKRGAANISALLRMPVYGEDFETAKKNAQANIEMNKQDHPILRGGAEFINDLAAYSQIPTLRGQGIKNYLANAALQGGAAGAVEGLKQGGNLGSAVGGGAMGTGIAAALQGIPYAGGAIAKGSKVIAPKIASKLSQTELGTILQAIKPESKALDLTKEQAQNLLMNTTERIRDAYKNLLNKKGDTVGNLLKELPDDNAFKAQNILDNYDSIYNSYSLSGNKELNPAINATKREYETIKDLILGDGKQRINEFTEKVKDLEFPKAYLETVKTRHKNKFHNTVLDNLGNDITKSQRYFNEEVLKPIRKNPEILDDVKNPEQFKEIFEKAQRIADKYDFDKELSDDFINRFWDAYADAGILKEGQNFIKPKELYDINKNINNMIDWDKAGAALKNDVLEQMYLSNAKRLSDLSPELKAANKAYADLMDFQKNEGIRRILNNQNNIDTASSALRNYNSTVTKGNTNRNIQDLEKMLVADGQKPFLNDIDDVNAAMDLLKKEGTGLGGLAGLIKEAAIRPSLRIARAINKKEVPNKIKELINSLSPVGKAAKGLGAKAGANMLYGGVEYNDYQN